MCRFGSMLKSLYRCVCMCVCVCICLFTCMHVCVYAFCDAVRTPNTRMPPWISNPDETGAYMVGIKALVSLARQLQVGPTVG